VTSEVAGSESAACGGALGGQGRRCRKGQDPGKGATGPRGAAEVFWCGVGDRQSGRTRRRLHLVLKVVLSSGSCGVECRRRTYSAQISAETADGSVHNYQ
jgi:hypothetical protein